MPSPFPGMNPYLEQPDAWEDFHHSVITHARDVLNEKVGERYLVKVLPNFETEQQAYLEIRDRRNRRLVTEIEVLSPTNKTPGPDHFEYLGKRNGVLATPTHFVEIDLRRGGKRPAPPELPPCDYYVLVSRYEERPRVGVWPIGLRERLPMIPIPLATPDPDITLDLQAVLHHVYDRAGYAKYIYSESPDPPLSAEDAAWARQFIPGG